mmetsp:Transcript_734/g.1544  ORF Transcript_734/g.1544 Transcript_734/m.1544 type:complete len:218 (-) Transcript_734:743-1396(-)
MRPCSRPSPRWVSPRRSHHLSLPRPYRTTRSKAAGFLGADLKQLLARRGPVGAYLGKVGRRTVGGAVVARYGARAAPTGPSAGRECQSSPLICLSQHRRILPPGLGPATTLLHVCSPAPLHATAHAQEPQAGSRRPGCPKAPRGARRGARRGTRLGSLFVASLLRVSGGVRPALAGRRGLPGTNAPGSPRATASRPLQHLLAPLAGNWTRLPTGSRL